MSTCSSILAWEISWIGETRGLQSMGSKRSWTQLNMHMQCTSSKGRTGEHYYGCCDYYYYSYDIWASLVAQLVKNLPAMPETWV